MIEKQGTAKKDNKTVDFTYHLPETEEEMKELTGVKNSFQFTVAAYEKKIQQKMNKKLFPHEFWNPHKKKKIKMKALKSEEDIAKAIKGIKLVKAKKKTKALTKEELREQISQRLLGAGRPADVVNEFLEQWDENMADAESAAD